MHIKSFFKNVTRAIVFILVIFVFGSLSYVVNKSKDHEIYLKKILLNTDNNITKAFFSPDDDIVNILISLINAEKKRISIAIYTITQKNISQALVDAANRGVEVECVVDRGYGTDRYSRVPSLANNNIPVWVFQVDQLNRALMHNKLAIFYDNILDKSIVFTGSYNFTRNANNANQENVVILDNKEITDRYKAQFDILKRRSLLISGTNAKHPQPEPSINRNTIEIFIEKLLRALRRYI